jgi:hypothetical protein
MILQGKGFYTWKLPNCDKGDPMAFAAAAKAAGLSHVLLKIADGTTAYYGNWGDPKDWITPIAQALRSVGVAVWGWQYIYGKDPASEARIALQRCRDLQVDGFVVNAEKEFKEPGKAAAAKAYMTQLRAGLPNTPIALSSFRYPTLHAPLPWKEFLEKCDFNMPQVYWVQAKNPRQQLERCMREFAAISPARPIFPTGAAYREAGWQPSVSEVQEFLQATKDLKLGGSNYWAWDFARSDILPGVWEAISAFQYSDTPAGPSPAGDIIQKMITALNSRDPEKVAALYTEKAAHVTADGTIKGKAAIRDRYKALFAKLPNAVFTLASQSGSGTTRYFGWTAASGAGKVQNGSDTLNLVGDLIAYHHQIYQISS